VNIDCIPERLILKQKNAGIWAHFLPGKPPKNTREKFNILKGTKGIDPNFGASKCIMHTSRDRLDMINEVLEACILAYPVSSFIISLYKQYQIRGSLSKKQLQGLYSKASKIPDLAPGKLAAIEAIIKRMPTRFKSELPEISPLFKKETETGELIDQILVKYPTHKRVLFLKTKYDNHELLSATDIADLKRFKALISR
jgi:hypothetical protein